MNTGEHLSEDALWDAAKTPPVGDDYAHLQLCPDCRAQLENIKLAQSALVEPPPPPVLSEESARRIGTVLRKAAEKEARRAMWWGAWWPFNWNPTWVLAPVAAVFLAFVAYRFTQAPADAPGPSKLAVKDDDVAPAQQQPTPPPMPEAPRPLPVKKVVAQVKRTKSAKSGNATIKKSQELSEGSVVATAKGGELVMALPDGSQIGLMSGSQVLLAKLEDKAVTLDVDKGSMKVVAPHDPTRELRVRVGDLEVFDVGTEFIVSREQGRTLVAVEEGEVEVKALTGESVPLKAGQAVEYKNGRLERQQWATADELPKPRPPVAAARPRAEVASAKKPSAEETPDIPTEPQKVAPPPAPVQDPEQPTAKQNEPEVAKAEAAPADEWSTPENLKDAPVHQPPPVPPPEPPQPPMAVAPPPPPPEAKKPAPAPKSDDENAVSFLAKLEAMKNKVEGAFKPKSRLTRANEIIALADAQRCNDAVQLANAWLTEPVPSGESFNLRRGVLSAKLRCLEALGRTSDAAAVRRELEKL